MLIQIIRHTPPWVFLLFFVLLALGIYQSRDRSISRPKVAILPGAMMMFSLYGVVSAFGVAPATCIAWVVGVGGAVVAGLKLNRPRNIRFSAENRLFSVPGSWVPLTLMMTIFFTKYAMGVIHARQLPIADGTMFKGAFSLVYGILSGAFLGQALVIWRAAGRKV